VVDLVDTIPPVPYKAVRRSEKRLRGGIGEGIRKCIYSIIFVMVLPLITLLIVRAVLGPYMNFLGISGVSESIIRRYRILLITTGIPIAVLSYIYGYFQRGTCWRAVGGAGSVLLKIYFIYALLHPFVYYLGTNYEGISISVSLSLKSYFHLLLSLYALLVVYYVGEYFLYAKEWEIFSKYSEGYVYPEPYEQIMREGEQVAGDVPTHYSEQGSGIGHGGHVGGNKEGREVHEKIEEEFEGKSESEQTKESESIESLEGDKHSE